MSDKSKIEPAHFVILREWEVLAPVSTVLRIMTPEEARQAVANDMFERWLVPVEAAVAKLPELENVTDAALRERVWRAYARLGDVVRGLAP